MGMAAERKHNTNAKHLDVLPWLFLRILRTHTPSPPKSTPIFQWHTVQKDQPNDFCLFGGSFHQDTLFCLKTSIVLYSS